VGEGEALQGRAAAAAHVVQQEFAAMVDLQVREARAAGQHSTPAVLQFGAWHGYPLGAQAKARLSTPPLLPTSCVKLKDQCHAALACCDVIQILKIILWLAMTNHKPISLTARLAAYPNLSLL